MSMATNRKTTESPLNSRTELVRLDSVEMDEDDEILPDFEAEVDGRRVWVTAVLERTATWPARKRRDAAVRRHARSACKSTAQPHNAAAGGFENPLCRLW